jgi:hypothetical protein
VGIANFSTGKEPWEWSREGLMLPASDVSGSMGLRRCLASVVFGEYLRGLTVIWMEREVMGCSPLRYSSS